MISSFQSKLWSTAYAVFMFSCIISHAQPPRESLTDRACGGDMKFFDAKNLSQVQYVLDSNKYVVLIVEMVGCGACNRLEKSCIIPQFMAKNPNVAIVKATNAKDVEAKYGIREFPTAIFIRDGQEVSRTKGGIPDIDTLQNGADALKQSAPAVAAPAKPAVSKAPTIAKAPPAAPAPAPQAASGKVVELSSAQQFEQLKKELKYKVIDVYTTWCGPCKSLKPVLHDLAPNYDNALFIAVDAEAYPSVVAPYGVTGYPTIIVLDKNNKVVNKTSGFGGKEFVKSWLDTNLGVSTGRKILKEECVRIN